jgi:MFS family permease
MADARRRRRCRSELVLRLRPRDHDGRPAVLPDLDAACVGRRARDHRGRQRRPDRRHEAAHRAAVQRPGATPPPGGYVGTAVATGAIGLAATVWQAGALRALAWISRGVRRPARDSLLASLAPREAYGRAFGLERAGDNLGAVIGPLLASALVALIGIRPTLLCAAIPGAFAAIAIAVAAREAPRVASDAVAGARLELERLRGHGLLRALLPIALFEMGNVATTLLILRSTQLLAHGGRSLAAAASLAILIYAAHNALASGVAIVGGRWVDRAAGAGLYLATRFDHAGAPVLICPARWQRRSRR